MHLQDFSINLGRRCFQQSFLCRLESTVMIFCWPICSWIFLSHTLYCFVFFLSLQQECHRARFCCENIFWQNWKNQSQYFYQGILLLITGSHVIIKSTLDLFTLLVFDVFIYTFTLQIFCCGSMYNVLTLFQQEGYACFLFHT